MTLCRLCRFWFFPLTQSQQEKRPPSAGMAGQQAQRAFDPNRAAGAHPEANLQNKMAGASGTS